MTDINELIELEVIKYDRSIGNWVGREDSFIAGGRFVLSKWQEANRWRKFGTDKLPEIGQQIVCKSSSGRYHLSNPISHDGIHWLAENFIEWKPIT